ncbi:hypothetical protein IID24_04680 [Patescibacteria group bacterium]|nr:hypothetical protein [Patescibacteria group bacterium]
MAEETQPKKKSNFKTLFIVLGVVIILFVFLALAGGGENVSERMAYIQAQGFLKDHLKSPSTAEFPLNFVHKKLLDNRFAIESYVDAENSFGATIRSDWSATVQYVGDSTWQLERLVLDGELLYSND